MASERKKKIGRDPGSKIESGKTGGPSTAHGIDYQLKYAVSQSLFLIANQLSDPLQDLSVTLESRLVHASGCTRSDMRLSRAEISSELKLNPSRQDILDWIKRIAEGPSEERHELIYASASGTLLVSLSALIRLAREVGSNMGELRRIADREQIKEFPTLLEAFGDHAGERLSRMTLTQMPEAVLDENILIRARMLSPEHADHLITFLKDTLFECMQHRQTLSIRFAIQQLGDRGVKLAVPQTLELIALPLPLRSVLASLQRCPAGLPNEVVAATAECPPDSTTSVLAEAIEGNAVHYDGEIWRLVITTSTLCAPPGALAHALESLLSFIEKNESKGRALVLNAVDLTRAVYEVAPKEIISVFRRLEKLLKRIGDKYLVLDLANLVIDAAEQQPRTVEDAKAQAHALICGCSWVYQRTGDLAIARRLARKSLELGEDISWDRNTAFCLKCEGRIIRLEAESQEGDVRSSLLESSAGSIRSAIKQFEGMKEIGCNHPEVGDCFSLLARTYLVARQYEEAKTALQKAYELIPTNGSKDHLDLLILTGDIYAATGQPDAAESVYTEALDLPEASDVQVSEIFARGYQQRARLRERQKQTLHASNDYRRAAEIWSGLHEYENSAKARWNEICLNHTQEKSILDRIAKEESHLVRVTAYNLYRDRSLAPKAIARRKQPTEQQLSQLLKDARERVAIEFPRR